MNWRDRSGLSLMELLVALALVAVIAGGLAASTTFGVRLLERTQTLQDDSPQIALRARLRHWMTTAVPPTRLAGFPTGVRGDRTQLSFTTISPTPFAPNSAALRITVDTSGADIILKIENLDDTGDVIDAHDRTLAFGADGGEISYFDSSPERAKWLSSWENESRLPALIRITADGNSTPAWPEFTVKLALALQN